jgi:hypothetical protein
LVFFSMVKTTINWDITPCHYGYIYILTNYIYIHIITYIIYIYIIYTHTFIYI